MRSRLLLLSVSLYSLPAGATVEVYVEENNGQAWIRYACTEGEVVRAFPLDVSVDKGRILGISDFFVGESTGQARGYGIFPASFRDYVRPGPGTDIDWAAGRYTPLAAAKDYPGDTLPGLGSAGVTLEFGALWDPADPASAPAPTGTLCALQISHGATVSVSPNQARGGVVSADPHRILEPLFTGAFVQPPELTGLSASNGTLRVRFAGGELEATRALDAPWTGTADADGEYTEPAASGTHAFYRVRGP